MTRLRHETLNTSLHYTKHDINLVSFSWSSAGAKIAPDKTTGFCRAAANGGITVTVFYKFITAACQLLSVTTLLLLVVVTFVFQLVSLNVDIFFGDGVVTAIVVTSTEVTQLREQVRFQLTAVEV